VQVRTLWTDEAIFRLCLVPNFQSEILIEIVLLTAGATGYERNSAMNDTPIDQIEQDIFIYDVSDEGLEIAAGTEYAGAYTIGDCTGLSSCPA
jgi:hypothetical protein